MNLAIVAYPTVDERDRRHIESFRARYDPQASRIDLHFTLVFPFNGEADRVAADVAPTASSMEPISFTIRRTAVVRDTVGGGAWNIFLVPDDGGASVVSLHDRLYAGTLRAYLRSDILFVPHITVGAAADVVLANEWAKELAMPPRVIPGAIAAIEVVDVGEHRVRSVARYELGGNSGTNGE